jgi:hypothetical protein
MTRTRQATRPGALSRRRPGPVVPPSTPTVPGPTVPTDARFAPIDS